MKNINKIFKWAMVALLIVSVVLLVLGFAGGWKEGSVDTLLGWTYIMVGLAIAAVVIVGLVVGAINDPKSLVKLGLGLVAVAVVCFIAYLIAPGAPAMGMLEQPSQATLKLTDTILYLTYFAGIVAVLSIVVGEIRLAITNKKG
jgi:phosphoglycerol transferase MdoB-like AlkP superfamily enzyme